MTERWISREQALLLGGVLLIAAAAWARTVHDASSMSCVMMPAMHGPWWVGCPLYILSWAVMMAAMMLPAVTPLVLLVARLTRDRQGASGRTIPWLFMLGYLFVWGAIGVPAYGGTLALQALAAHSPAAAAFEPDLAGLTLFLAGAYQWLPLKEVCLRHCQSPLHFVMHGWHEGKWAPSAWVCPTGASAPAAAWD